MSTKEAKDLEAWQQGFEHGVKMASKFRWRTTKRAAHYARWRSLRAVGYRISTGYIWRRGYFV